MRHRIPTRTAAISVLIFGQPYWGSFIAELLTTHAADMRPAFIAPRDYARVLVRPPRSERAVILRVGYRVGASTARGRLFDAYWALLRRSMPDAVPCHYWLGTDVLQTTEEAEAGTLRGHALLSSGTDLHLAAAPWLVDELQSVGVHAVTAMIPGDSKTIPQVVAPLPSQFSVLTYLPTGRFDYYGGPTILESARRLPGIRFDVVGTRRDPTGSATPNVRWHGWVEDMAPYYRGTVAVVRLPRHDAMGGTVLEGLLHARHVIFTYELPFVQFVRPATADALVEALEAMHRAHLAGRLGLNLAGRLHALEQYDESNIAGQMAALIRSRV